MIILTIIDIGDIKILLTIPVMVMLMVALLFMFLFSVTLSVIVVKRERAFRMIEFSYKNIKFELNTDKKIELLLEEIAVLKKKIEALEGKRARSILAFWIMVLSIWASGIYEKAKRPRS